MMDDFAYLEEIGRKIGDWGSEIARGGFSRGEGRGRGGRGSRGRGRGGSNPNGKRDILKMQLEVRDIDIDLLPSGMEKRKFNQSGWDPK